MGPFKIRLGIPEMLAYWQELRQEAARGTLNKEDLQLYKKWGRAMVHLAADLFYPGLKTHEIPPLSRRYGMKVWQSYLENKNSRAARIYWVYGPDQKDITIIGLEPHPEDKKSNGYQKVLLSELPEF